MGSKSLEFLESRERFIPVQVKPILQRILADPRLSPAEREQLAALAEMLQARIHFTFLEQCERLKELYDPFNPDRDTQLLCDLTDQELEAQFEQLRDGIEFFVTKGNYSKISPEQLAACLESKSRWGLAVKVDPSQYRELDVYYRGVRQEERYESSWRTFYRRVPYKVWVFARVAVLVREDNPRYGDIVLLKLFKDVVVEDLKMTWPNVRVLMRPFDQLMIAVTALGGVFTPLIKLVLAVTLSPILLLGVAGGCIGAMVRAILRFFSCKSNYIKTLTHNLYYQNVANNLSALARLVDSAEAEEVKEALLAYYMLYVERDRDYTTEQLDARIEQWLTLQFSLSHVDFEVEDALQKLEAQRLLVGREVTDGEVVSQGENAGQSSSSESAARPRIWKVYDLPTALRRMDQWWDDYFPYNEPTSGQVIDRVADATWPPFPPGVPREPSWTRQSRADTPAASPRADSTTNDDDAS